MAVYIAATVQRRTQRVAQLARSKHYKFFSAAAFFPFSRIMMNVLYSIWAQSVVVITTSHTIERVAVFFRTKIEIVCFFINSIRCKRWWWTSASQMKHDCLRAIGGSVTIVCSKRVVLIASDLVSIRCCAHLLNATIYADFCSMMTFEAKLASMWFCFRSLKQ